MKLGIFRFLTKSSLIVVFCISCLGLQAQEDKTFWKKVRWGGAVGAAFGSGYTNVSLAPSAIYEFNQYVGLGLGLQGTYIKDRDVAITYKAWLYGGSVIGVVNPIPEIQLSAELEQLRVNLDINDFNYGNYKENFWNTALFLGAGYRAQNVVIGVRYNVLFDEDDFVYSTAWMPFVRLYF